MDISPQSSINGHWSTILLLVLDVPVFVLLFFVHSMFFGGVDLKFVACSL